MTPEAEGSQKAALGADAARRSLAALRSAAPDTNGKPDEDCSEREQAHNGGEGRHALAPGRREGHTVRAAGARPAPPFDCLYDLIDSGEDGYYGRTHEEPELHGKDSRLSVGPVFRNDP
jgi:hypothetical protein